MPSRFLRNIRSVFHRQPTKKEEAPSFRSTNCVFDDWATSAVEDLPPPYTDSPESETHFQDKKHFTLPPFASPCLQICPHETLSFEALQKTATSLGIGNTSETIDALTLSCHEHRSQSDGAKNVCTSSPGLLRGFGTYSSQGNNDPVHSRSVLLSFHWDLEFLDGVRGQVDTAAELQHFLGADGIWLCPHKRISDSDVINAIYGFVKWPSGSEVRTSCDCCDTDIKILARKEGDDEMCRVTTKRYLGAVEKPDDPQWLAQCGV
ncbi:MAG: hypothetical protein ASARMPREDX12_006864 [Alectoria sarmentosa]|nr:MAG: hypothetical protein ASARMPREDX12_006864 [Alectoria sarmentosa]